jgi:TATA-box binding protein (TBP) (component of TFIID and TFIIIB)
MSEFKEDIYFSPYRVSTITCNANIGEDINLNLKILFDNILIVNKESNDEGVVWVQYMKEGEELNRGEYPKKRRKSKKNKMKKNRFDNQVTIICKNNCYMPNIKIFKNGNIQLTGIKNINDTEVIVNHIIYNIENIYNNITKDIINSRDENYELNLKFQNFKIRMINTDFKLYCDSEYKIGFGLKRKEIHKLFISNLYNNKCSFQPGIYQGVKLEYFWNKCNNNKNGICSCPKQCYGKGKGEKINECKKVTGALFESGSILITGGVSFEQVNETYDYICKFLKKHKDVIKKTQPSAIMMNGELDDIASKNIESTYVETDERAEID